MLRRLRGYFLAGLAISLPLGLTLAATWFIVSLVGNLPSPLLRWLPGLAQLPQWLLTLIGFLALITLVTAIGALATGFIGNRLLRWLDQLMQRLPLAREIYSSARQLTDAVFVQRSSLRRVVIVEYPRRDMFAIGFVTSETRFFLPDGRPALTVFIPSAPNPTSGWLALVPENQVYDCNLTIEQGLKLVVSGGMVRPPKGTDES
ncbi:MAG: DUF502 domain-containing protein [candidate division WOR-3 bacterium]